MKAPSRAVSNFEAQVYKACEAIPKGKVSTYGELAKAIGKPKSARAVGGALKRNPFAPTVPCHRVVGANLSLTGFEGSRGDEKINKKKSMLENEGVLFSAGPKAAIVDMKSIYKFPCNHAV